MKIILFISLLFASSCVPIGQGKVQTQVATEVSETPMPSELLTTVFSLSSLKANFVADEAFLQGQDISINDGNAKGTLRLLSSMVLPISDSPYLILPLEGNLVLGSGIYLLLLETQGSRYVQTDDVYLGSGVNLFGLEYANDRITSVTIDPRAGRPPFNPSRGKVQVFEIIDSKLIEH
jgi:hypothetical protein